MTQEQIEKLRGLKNLLDAGIITAEEYDIEKTKVLEEIDVDNASDIPQDNVIAQTTPYSPTQTGLTNPNSNNSNPQAAPKKTSIKKIVFTTIGFALGIGIIILIAILIIAHSKGQIDRRITGETEIKIINSSSDPYDIWVDSEYEGTIYGSDFKYIRTYKNSIEIKATQQSGYLIKATKNERTLVNLKSGHAYECTIGNSKKSQTIRDCKCCQ